MIFLLVLSPFVYHRIQCCENDAIIGRILIEISNYDNNQIESDEQKSVSYGPNWFSGIKLFGWTLIPIFIIFIPLGLIPIFRNFNYPNYLLIIGSVILAAPIIYSTSIAPDTRYVFALFPFFCVISLFGIKWISDHFDNKKIILVIITIAIISSSIIFLDMKKIDFGEDKDAYQITQLIINDIKGINQDSKMSKYFQIVELENKWPIKETSGEYIKEYEIKMIDPSNYSTLNELLSHSENENITHLIIDEKQNQAEFLNEIYHNEFKYNFLVKEFDSKDKNFNYKVKIFKINYIKFNEVVN